MASASIGGRLFHIELLEPAAHPARFHDVDAAPDQAAEQPRPLRAADGDQGAIAIG